jgi:hypothetical protein
MAATREQSDFIKDLVLQKFRVFAEFKKWLATTGIVRTNGQIFKQSMNLVQISNRITPKQATEIITEMEQMEDVEYKEAYDQEQIDEVAAIMAEIKQEVSSWTFAS